MRKFGKPACVRAMSHAWKMQPYGLFVFGFAKMYLEVNLHAFRFTSRVRTSLQSERFLG